MYNLLKAWITLSDEYPVENTHSIIRAQTRHSDTAAQLVNKVKSIFVSKTKQANFCLNFTPSKHFAFSHGQLKYLKLKSSEFLTTTLEEIIKNQSSTTLHYPKKKNGKVKVTMPQLFGNKMMKENILPMSFLSDTPSNENTKCDLPACKADDDNEDWSVLTGCWHSFHNVCMESATCPLCKEAINKKVEELGNIAKEAILFGNTADLNDADNEDEEVAMENCPIVPTTNDDQISESVTEMKARITNLAPSAPSEIHSTQEQRKDIAAEPSKPPHCKTCHHPMKGHSCRKSQAKCTMCPNSLCVSTSESCLCSLHTKNNDHCQQRLNTDKSSIHAQTLSVAVENTYPGVTEWLLPSNISQSTSFGQISGSNACTVISVLGATQASNNNLAFPSSFTDLPEIITTFSNTMNDGNTLYGLFDVDPCQQNLEVKEVVEVLKSMNIGINIIEDEGFFLVEELIVKLQSLAHSGQQVFGVLIVPPDKAMLIYIKDGKFVLMDSHQYGTHGALIARSTS
jgi:hypothetical protein